MEPPGHHGPGPRSLPRLPLLATGRNYMIEWFIIPLGMAWWAIWAWKGADLLPDVEDPEHDQFRDWT